MRSLIALLLALWLAPAWAQVPMTGAGLGAPAGGTCTPSYANGSGDRRASVTVSKAGGWTIGGGALAAHVDGSFATSAGPLGSWFWNAFGVNSSQLLIYDFGAGNDKLITEAKWYQDTTASHGVWQWCGSTDASTCTATIGSTFTLGGATTQTQTQLNGNTTAYRAYILQGSSGTTSSAPWLEEIEFKQCP
jgi:hypothetical protein